MALILSLFWGPTRIILKSCKFLKWYTWILSDYHILMQWSYYRYDPYIALRYTNILVFGLKKLIAEILLLDVRLNIHSIQYFDLLALLKLVQNLNVFRFFLTFSIFCRGQLINWNLIYIKTLFLYPNKIRIRMVYWMYVPIRDYY